jgi:paraquat-inducible protein B
MSKKANPTVIGLFIVAGVVLGVTGLVVFSSGNLFSHKQRFILYFDSSMKGMNPGAPVQYRGVTIGKVTEVLIAHNQAPDDRSMPLIVEIDQTSLRRETDRRIEISSDAALQRLVADGLRARLDAANLITGVLMVQLEVSPDNPPPVYHQLKKEYPEIPTAPTDIDVLMRNIARMDVKGIADKLNAILTRLDALLADVDLKATFASVTNLLASVNGVVSSKELTNSLASLHRTLDKFGDLATNIDSRVGPVASDLTNTLDQMQSTLADLRVAVQGMSAMVAPDARLQGQLTGALDQLGRAARAIADLADFLKRNPNALIKGRTPEKP